jgi:hypothetical protein
MLLGLLKKIAIAGTILLGVISVVYLSKPDRGGTERCQRIFGFHSLAELGLAACPLSTWSPFENPKFRFRIAEKKFDDLKDYLALNGFQRWEFGGVQYGSVNIGWDETTNVAYSKKKFSGHVHIIVYDQTNSSLYMIVSQ